MGDGGTSGRPTDAGALATAFVLQLLGLPADANDLLHRSGGEALDEAEILRVLRPYPVKARFVSSHIERLNRTPMPALAATRDGGWLVLGGVNGGDILVHDPRAGRHDVLTQAVFDARWNGRLLLIARRAALDDPYTRFGLTWFIQAIRKYRQPLVEVFVASFFVQVFALLTPLFFQVIIDKVFVQRGLSTLDVLSLGLGVLAMFEVVLGGLRTYILAHTSNRIDVELGARLFRHLFALPMAYFQARRVGDTVARVRELETIRQFLTSASLTLGLDLFFGCLFLIVLLIYSPQLTLVVAGSLPLYALISTGVTPSFRERLQERFRRGADNQSFLVESVSGAETIKSMAIEPIMQRRWEEQIAAYVTASFSVIRLSTTATQIVALVNRLTTVLILFVGAGLVIRNRMTVGELVAFNMIAGLLAAPVLRLSQLWQDIQQARLSIDRVGDILNAMPEPGAHDIVDLPSIRGEIRVENVSFRYRPDSQPILHEVSLRIHPGEVVGIVGSSGSGKSTLAKLIQRLYVPEGGRILVDGVDLSLANAAWLRRQIGVVLQESVLFNRTVRENIALAEPGLSIERVIEASELAGAHEFISGLREGYSTVIGERGASLSGGQRQRIAIARALLGDPRILIFDEATSALDYESERAIQANMRRISAGRTVLIIAHRLSTVRRANRIITIEQGRILEEGDHDSLLAANGRYAALWRMQSGEETG